MGKFWPIALVLVGPGVAMAQGAAPSVPLPGWKISEVCARDSASAYCTVFEGEAYRTVSGSWSFVPDTIRRQCVEQVRTPADQSWRVLGDCIDENMEKSIDRGAVKTWRTPGEAVPPAKPAAIVVPTPPAPVSAPVSPPAAVSPVAPPPATPVKPQQQGSLVLPPIPMPTVSPLAAQEAEVARRRAAEEQEAKKKAEADAAARAKAQADAEAARRANAERDARIKAQADADAKAKADAEAKARAEADAKRKLDEDNRARALAEAETKKRQDLAACQQTIDAAAASGMIRFASGRATLVPESSAILDRVAAAAKSCPTAHLSIEGHTDSTGEPERNIRLSAERAASVADYLAKAGVDPWRLKPQGMGAAKPIASNETAEGRAQNRRIAFVATLMSDGERKAAMDAQARRAAEEKTAVEQLAAALKPCRDGIAASVKSEPILFRPSQSAVTREGAVVLDRVVIALKQSCPSETITVEGHTDATGSADEDKELSEARANSVIRYLSRAGFDAKRLRAVGYGRTKPVAANDTEENRAKNRRIEFAVSR